jgi:hypothetical protein
MWPEATTALVGFNKKQRRSERSKRKQNLSTAVSGKAM